MLLQELHEIYNYFLNEPFINYKLSLRLILTESNSKLKFTVESNIINKETNINISF